MNNLLEFIKSDIYSITITIVAILFIIRAIYNNIRYTCLKKAAEKVASIESLENLTGEEKFALVVQWIDDELPKIFKNSLFKSVIEALVQYVYDNSFAYMKNYIKRKTGHDIGELIEEHKEDN